MSATTTLAAAERRGRMDARRRKGRDAVPYRDIRKAEAWVKGWESVRRPK